MIQHRIEGDKELLKGLDNLSSNQHRAHLMDLIASYGVSSTQQRFIEEKGPDDQSWPKSLRAIEDGGSTLRDTARLFQSLTHEAAAGFAAWGTNVIYAGIHQFGGDIKPVKAKRLAFKVGSKSVFANKVTIPARPYLGISTADQVEIKEIFNGWATEAFQ